MRIPILDRLLGRGPAPTPPKPERGQIRTAPIPFGSVTTKETQWLNDDTVYTVKGIYSDVLLTSGYRIDGKDKDRADVKTLMDALQTTPGFKNLLRAIAGAQFTRFAAVEIVWDTEGQQWKPKKFNELPVRYTYLAVNDVQEVEGLTVSTTAGMQPLPPQNCVVARHEPTVEHPLGQSVADHLKELLGNKRRVDVALPRIVERFSGASIVGWYDPLTPEDEQNLFLKALQALASVSVGILPGPRGEKGNEIELLELKSSAGLDFAVQVGNMYERRFARAVLGSVLAVFESEFGTRAQSETHLKMLESVIAAAQDDVEEPVNTQLIKPLLTYNIAGGADLDVQFVLNTPDFSDLAKTGQWVDGLIAGGILDAEDEHDNNNVRKLFGMEERDWTKLPKEPVDPLAEEARQKQLQAAIKGADNQDQQDNAQDGQNDDMKEQE